MKRPPIPEWVIVGGALEVIRRHGDEAVARAAMRADELREAGDLDGHGTWCRIVSRVEELLRVDEATHH